MTLDEARGEVLKMYHYHSRLADEADGIPEMRTAATVHYAKANAYRDCLTILNQPHPSETGQTQS